MSSIVFDFLVVAGIIVFGYASDQFFRRTGVPSFIFLILIGVLLGPVFGIFPRASILSSLGIFAELTLLVVLFYGGMDTKIGSAVSGGGRAFIQVMLYVLPSTLLIGLLLSYLLHWGLVLSLIFASMVGGETTAAVVIPLSRSLKLPETTVTFLTLESAMNSVLSIILFFAFVQVFSTGSNNWYATFTSVVANFSIGIVVGGALSLAWVYLLGNSKSQRYTYVFTIGLIFLTYSFSSLVGGSGELSVLVFGIVLGNYRLVNSLLNTRIQMDELQSQLSVFHGELTFLLETLFFVSLGLALAIDVRQILYNFSISVMLLAVLLAVRFLAVSASTARSELRLQKPIITLMCAQGLVPATLAILSVEMNLPLSSTFLNLATYVIVLTNVVTAAGSVWTMASRKYSFREFMSGLEGSG